MLFLIVQIEKYTKELEEMQNASKEEYLASLRRRSSGFSRGVSKYRGVARYISNQKIKPMTLLFEVIDTMEWIVLDLWVMSHDIIHIERHHLYTSKMLF